MLNIDKLRHYFEEPFLCLIKHTQIITTKNNIILTNRNNYIEFYKENKILFVVKKHGRYLLISINLIVFKQMKLFQN